MTEADFQAAVIEAAHSFRWVVAHFRPAQNARGEWRTPVAADGKGFPDLVLIHPVRGLVWFRELKSATGKLAPEQRVWGDNLVAAGADWAVWRPGEWPSIVTALSDGRARC